MDSKTQDIMIYITMTVSVCSVILGLVNHKKVRSSCCGKKVEMSFDVDNTSPLMRATASTTSTS